MLPVLFAISWIGYCVILLGIYLLVLLVRATIQLISWFIDEFIVEPREQKKLAQRRRSLKKP